MQRIDAAAALPDAADTATDPVQRSPEIDPTLCDEVSDPAQPQPYASAAEEAPAATRVDFSSSNGTDEDAAADGNGAGTQEDLGARLWEEAQQGQQIRDDYDQKAAPPRRQVRCGAHISDRPRRHACGLYHPPKSRQSLNRNLYFLCRRKKKRKSAGFLDTMADVEASQNAFLSQTSDEGDANSPLTSVEQTGSYDDPATWSSIDWDEFAEQVAPTTSAEQLRESKSR